MKNLNKSEESIEEVINFLNNNIDASPFNQDDPIKCVHCLFRKIAILVLSKKIKIVKINFENKLDFNFKTDQEKNKQGSHWHNSIIENINIFLKNKNLETEKEPKMFFGRADLFVKKKKLYIEVGTINIYKLLCNINNMKDCCIHILSNEKNLVEIKL